MSTKMASSVLSLFIITSLVHLSVQEMDSVGGANDSDHTNSLLPSPCKEPTQCCELFGRRYKSGEKLRDVCADIECNNGQWEFTGYFSGDCEQCHIYDDPHFKTFDGYRYDMHGPCTYRISQTWSEHSLIVGRFKQCNGKASCVDFTIFYDDLHTAIEIDHSMGHDVVVNGVNFTVQSTITGLPIGGHMSQVLAWADGECNMFQGSFGYLVKTCPTEMYIWAAPVLYGNLCGLCGTLNGNIHDDFMPCGAVTSYPLNPFPLAFPIDVLMSNQSTPECDPNQMNPNNTVNTDNPCKMDASNLARLHDECSAAFQGIDWSNHDKRRLCLVPATKSCVADLCLMEQNRATRAEKTAWTIELKVMLQRKIKQEIMTDKEESEDDRDHGGCMGGKMCNNPVHVKSKFLFEANIGN